MQDTQAQVMTVPEKAAEDLGFGKAMAGQRGARLINRDGSFNVLRNRKTPFDYLSYATLLNMGWLAFFGLVVVVFAAVNVLFCWAYLLCGHGALATTGPSLGVSRTWQAFFFSVHTLSTIGYGNVVPVGRTANLLVAAEAMTALLNAALVTGLVFARFSKPNVRIEFSTHSVMRLRDKPALLVRLRNQTRSEVLEVEANLLAWFHDPEDHKKRHFHMLSVERTRVTFLPLSWTVAHFITPESPFHGLTEQQFHATFGELMLQVRGVDQSSSQTVYARASYTAEEIAWGAQYADQYTRDPETGLLGIDPERFHRVVRE